MTMKKKTIRALGLDKQASRLTPRPVDVANRLRRMRNELALLLAAVDDTLVRVETKDAPLHPLRTE